MKYTKDKRFIGAMFDEISPTYDKLNHLLSGYLDNRWRRSAVKHLARIGKYENILDLACGSGDLGLEFTKLHPQKIYSADLSFEMLKIDNAKLPQEMNLAVKAEAEKLPFSDDFFHLCGIGFGVRNFENLSLCAAEINRVLKPGGRFLTIEMFKPENPNLINRAFRLYFEKILPKIGNMVSKSRYAYDYLFESVDNFLPVSKYSQILEQNGFKITKITNNFLGIVHSVFAEKL
jgi:demethylmenaquinone methyltransferase/2-methoxy-6-polyprenyl-1,4-benzoquinol methylase